MKGYYVKNGLSLFWGGPYSQWEFTDFTCFDIEFNCCEQMMMFCKAVVHDDFEIAKQVMASFNPSEQKKLGRKVKNFSEEKWSKSISMACVYMANYCKFDQNEKYKEYLLNDPGHTIVEASPVDKIWGIGLPTESPLAWDRKTWKGENRLGDCITDVKWMFSHPDHEDIDNYMWCYRTVEAIFNKWKEHVS